MSNLRNMFFFSLSDLPAPAHSARLRAPHGGAPAPAHPQLLPGAPAGSLSDPRFFFRDTDPNFLLIPDPSQNQTF